VFGSPGGLAWAFAAGTAVGTARPAPKRTVARPRLMTRLLTAAMWLGHARRLIDALRLASDARSSRAGPMF
jgi:hypothetical protein